MALTDILVLFGLAVGLPTLIVHFKRLGARGGALGMSVWIGFTGLVLVLTMSAHTLDVLSRWYVGQGYDGTPWTYDFRIYSLLLLGTLLGWLGGRLVLFARQFSMGDVKASHGLEISLLVLLLVLPLVPVHAFFAVPLSIVALLNLVVLSPWSRFRRAAEVARIPATAMER